MDSRRYFTLAEAESLIPELEDIFARVLQMHLQLRSTQQRLKNQGYPPTADVLSDSPQPHLPANVRQLRARFRALYEAIGDEIGTVESYGVLVKDIRTGLVDFHSLLSGQEEVLLCWRLGEKRISWWHDMENGFGGRQSVEGQLFASPPDRH